VAESHHPSVAAPAICGHAAASEPYIAIDPGSFAVHSTDMKDAGINLMNDDLSSSNSYRNKCDGLPIAVSGTGPAGLTAALLLARLGHDVALIGPRQPTMHRAADGGQTRDTRTSALFAPSLRLLENLAVWDARTEGAAALAKLRLVDATGRVIQAPELLFDASEIGFAEFGLNIPNAALVDRLTHAISDEPRILWHNAKLQSATTHASHIAIRTSGDQFDIKAALLVAADGRASPSRRAAGITAHTHAYPQVAIATRFGHTRCHENTSTEFHRTAGPLTTVPQPGLASSLVWVDTPNEAERLMRLDGAAFLAELADHLGDHLGGLSDLGPRVAFPLQAMTVTRYGAGRTVLVAEAGHVIPPIGAQGLNLGLRDVAVLADCLLDQKAGATNDLTTERINTIVADYDRRRRADVGTRTAMVDLLNRSLFTNVAPVSAARSATMMAMATIGPFRRQLMKVGMGLAGTPPRCMRPGFDLAAKRNVDMERDTPTPSSDAPVPA